MDETNRRNAYLQQCWVAKHKTQTVAMDCYLDPPGENDDTPVLMLHGKFSRFKLTIIDNSSEERKIVSANILADEVPYLLQQYELALQEKLRYKHSDKSAQEAVSPAYTVRFHMGTYKGRTPAEVLIENPACKDAMLRQIEFLNQNLKQWPANGEVIGAIEDALCLLDQGALNSEEATASANATTATVFQEDFKVMSSGNESTRICVKVSITGDFERNNPWNVHIENIESPMRNGVVDRETVISHVVCNMALNDKEMAGMIYMMRKTLQYFEERVFRSAISYVEKNRWRPST